MKCACIYMSHNAISDISYSLAHFWIWEHFHLLVILIFTLYLGAPILGTYMSTGVLVSSILIPSSFFMDFFCFKIYFV